MTPWICLGMGVVIGALAARLPYFIEKTILTIPGDSRER
jgi:hypothetical protein